MNLTEPLKSIGATKQSNDTLRAGQIDLLRETLTGATPVKPAAIPYGWQWVFFHEAKPNNQLGRDGHERLGNFIPDLPLKRRMWAGGNINFHNDPKLDTPIAKTTTIKNIEAKTGASGELIFVKLEHVISQGDMQILTETQNLVYKEEAVQNAAPKKASSSKQPEAALLIEPTSILMFRYSALTFNSHRIHYDGDYARDIEGYNGIVFHGPLTATLLMNFAAMHAQRPLKTFSFRGTAPIDTMEPFTIGSINNGKSIELIAQRNDGVSAMLGAATLT